jgi:hypothetical protein
MPQTRPKAPRSLNSNSDSAKRATQATIPKSKTMPSRLPSSGVIRTNESSFPGTKKPRVKSEAELSEKDIQYNKITIDEIKKKLKELGVLVPNRKNKRVLFELMEEELYRRPAKSKYRAKEMAELEKLLAKHKISLEPELIEALKTAYIVPAASKDEVGLPVKVHEASQQDRVRCGRNKQPKATKALSGQTAPVISTFVNTQQTIIQPEYRSIDDENSTLSPQCELLVDSTSNTPYEATLYCKNSLENVDKFYKLEVSSYTSVHLLPASLCLRFSCRTYERSHHGHLIKVLGIRHSS